MSTSPLLLYLILYCCLSWCPSCTYAAPLNVLSSENKNGSPETAERKTISYDKGGVDDLVLLRQYQHEIVLRSDYSNGSNSSSRDSLAACDISGLCPEGIANIVAGLSAMLFLGVLACLLWHWEVQSDRKARVRSALERNKIIDRQMEDEKKKRQERVEQFIAKSKKEGGEDTPTDQQKELTSVAALERTMTSDSELSSDERKELLSSSSRTRSKSPDKVVTVEAEVTS